MKYDETLVVADCVTDVLKLSGSKERFTGEVVGIDSSGSTVFIRSADRQF
jgi:hypothetical protein